jgi:hypothetical protein
MPDGVRVSDAVGNVPTHNMPHVMLLEDNNADNCMICTTITTCDDLNNTRNMPHSKFGSLFEISSMLRHSRWYGHLK